MDGIAQKHLLVALVLGQLVLLNAETGFRFCIITGLLTPKLKPAMMETLEMAMDAALHALLRKGEHPQDSNFSITVKEISLQSAGNLCLETE